MSDLEIRAVLEGLALGDALGWPVEFYDKKQIAAEYGESGITEVPDPAEITDDTQMTLALGRALIDQSKNNSEEFIYHLAKRFREWARSPENNRAPGNTCMRAVRNLEKGIDPHKSGIIDSQGCGSAMRVAVLGYLFQNDPEKLKSFAIDSSIVTHRSIEAELSAVAAAYMVKCGLDGMNPYEMLDATIEFTGKESTLLTRALHLAYELSFAEHSPDIMKQIGKGWRAHEAVALSWYAVARHPDNWVETVRLAVNGLPDGDRDSIGCIAGGIQAARLGIDALPKDWINRLEPNYADEIAIQSKELAALKSRCS